jgi:hypothetical protein
MGFELPAQRSQGATSILGPYWDRGRLARTVRDSANNALADHQQHQLRVPRRVLNSNRCSRYRAQCGRDARGPSNYGPSIYGPSI